ncbi:hypothetical protein [Mycobacterium asiaticum]|uniref:hypothetical protein n=1 Tax=Mycobacterium asiaticum TaxID=1790 RepID=UPI000A5FBEFF|nr:hypothetical protein [Mycobacterium asiaticum]
MSARHRLIEQSNFRLPGVGAAFSASLLAVALFAVIFSGTLFTPTGPDNGPDAAPPNAVPPATEQVSQEGTLVAVSSASLTARSADGYTRTYVVTPDTLAITKGGSAPITNAPMFSINDEVAIVGTISNGTAMVTAVAHRGLGHGDARPMDYLAAAAN